MPARFFPVAARRITAPRIHWKEARKAITKKPRRIMARHRLQRPPSIRARPFRRIDPISAEMWEDYRIFKGAGLLSEWRRKWVEYLPEPD
jgi:hypothetical protein